MSSGVIVSTAVGDISTIASGTIVPHFLIFFSGVADFLFGSFAGFSISI